MRLGIFGGTFDPPHIGHLILAAEAREQLSLDQVLWVVTPYPPHKKQQKITPVIHRQRMVELAIDGNPGFVISTIDIDRLPPHFAVDTMSLLRAQQPDNEYYYLMGLDSLNDLHTWHRPDDFISLCDGIVIMGRQEEVIDNNRPELEIRDLKSKLLFLKTPIIEISGTNIRSRIRNGKQFRYYVPEKVYQYIYKNHLYID
jgi:nicotinate-nucleotide adenylyltransferase